MTSPGFDRQAITDYLAAQPDVVVAYLFGSVARGGERPDSIENILIHRTVERLLHLSIEQYSRAIIRALQ